MNTPAALAVALLGLIGCAGPTAKNLSGDSATPVSAESVELALVSLDEWHREIASLQGEIVVVDMWATWCIPCIERFPHMVALSRRYESAGVRFVSTCLDDPEDEQAVVYARRFLEQQQATFDNYLIDENIADSFAELDLFSIPAVFIYAPDGELRYRLTGDDPNNQFTGQDVEDAIEELLDPA